MAIDRTHVDGTLPNLSHGPHVRGNLHTIVPSPHQEDDPHASRCVVLQSISDGLEVLQRL